MLTLTRRTVFFLLTMATIVALAASLIMTQTVTDGTLANTFWLLAEVFLTVVVLESVLQSDAAARRRNEDSFAFRTFTARGLSLIQQVAGVEESHGEASLFSAALKGSDEFAEAARSCAERIAKAGRVDPASYNSHYLAISNGVWELSTNYVRIFATSKQDMIDQYLRLQDLSSEWVYREDLNPDVYERIEAGARRDPNNDYIQADLQESRKRRKRSSIEVFKLTKSTASTLADLAERAKEGGVAAS